MSTNVDSSQARNTSGLKKSVRTELPKGAHGTGKPFQAPGNSNAKRHYCLVTGVPFFFMGFCLVTGIPFFYWLFLLSNEMEGSLLDVPGQKTKRKDAEEGLRGKCRHQ